MRDGAFADAQEPLDAGGLAKLERFALPAGAVACAVSPAVAAGQTAARLGLPAAIDPALRDMDPGAWAGRSLADIHAADPQALAAWIADPAAGAPGGESLDAVRVRMVAWLATRVEEGASLLAITHPMVMRAALAAALDMPAGATLRIDIAPLCAMRLSWNRGWRLQAIG